MEVELATKESTSEELMEVCARTAEVVVEMAMKKELTSEELMEVCSRSAEMELEVAKQTR